MRKPKRYVLIQAEGRLPQGDLHTLTRMLEERHGNVGMTLVDTSRTSLIVKTDPAGAKGIRESLAEARFGRMKVTTILTSGNIGKLKKRAQGSSAREDVEVPQ